MRPRVFGAALVAVCCLLLTNETVAQRFGADPGTGYEAIRQRILATGQTTVIVKLTLDDYVPEGRLATKAARAAQQARIKAAQGRFLKRVSSPNITLKRSYRFIPYVALVVNLSGLQSLANIPGVELVQPDIVGKPDVAESRLVIGADVANAAGCDGSDWAVAVLDSGVDLTHDAFGGGKIVAEACFSTHLPGSNQESMCPDNATESTAAGSGGDCLVGDFGPPTVHFCPHGSLVAGVAAGNGGGGITGVAPAADIISVRVFTDYTNGDDCPGGSGGPFATGCPLVNASDLMAAIEHVGALSDSIQIAAINISIDMTFTPGGPVASTTACDAVSSLSGIKDAVDFTNSLGIPTVASTGNQDKTDRINPPSCLSNVISVGYTQDGSTFNNISTIADSVGVDPNRATFMDFWAPGEWITSAWPSNTSNTARGTSVAAPQVSGAIAALRSKGTASDPDFYVNLLRTTGITVTDYSPAIDITKPRIDVGAACEALSAIALDAKVLLEGPYAGSDSMSVSGSFFSSLPLLQPYGDAALSGTPLAYSGTQTVVSPPAPAIDWVLVELRTDATPGSMVARRPAFVTVDGSVIDFHGGPVGFLGLDSLSYHVVIRHRNHADVMSNEPVDFASGTGTWDFTTALTQAYTGGASAPMKDLGDGRFAMFAAESNADGQITAPDFNLWNAQTTAGAAGYESADHNFDGIVTAPDFNLWNANTTAGAKSTVPEL